MTLVYRVAPGQLGLNSNKYQLLWQKQSGSEHDQINVNAALPPDATGITTSPDVQRIGTRAVYDNDLSLDRALEIGYH